MAGENKKTKNDKFVGSVKVGPKGQIVMKLFIKSRKSNTFLLTCYFRGANISITNNTCYTK